MSRRNRFRKSLNKGTKSRARKSVYQPLKQKLLSKGKFIILYEILESIKAPIE